MSGLSRRSPIAREALPRGGPPAHQGPQACQQLLALERLHQIVIGAGIEPLDAVVGLRAGREDQDRHVARGTDAPADLDSVELGKPEVEHDQVGDELFRELQRLDAVARRADLVALLAQGPAKDVGDRRVVLDDQYTAGAFVGAQHQDRG